MAEQWLSIVDYARATGISDMTIRRRIRTGRIRAELRDGKYYIPVDINSHENERRSSHGSSNYQNQVIKNHPNPDRTARHNFQERSTPHIRRADEVAHNSQNLGHNTHQNVHVSANQVGFGASGYNNRPAWANVPDHMARPLIDAGLASVEARALIEFCDRALDQARATVDNVEAKYAARIESLSAQLMNRDQEIKSLNQQIEDLQLLVQILERKKVG